MKGPVHAHDCETCAYLGSERSDGVPVDLYVHRFPHRTYIVRYGSDGPDYVSGENPGLRGYTHDFAHVRARILASNMGLT